MSENIHIDLKRINNIDYFGLSKDEARKMDKMIAGLKNVSPALEDIWDVMDDVWDELGCDNKVIDLERISEFYKHPVWLLNDLFIAQHDLSMQHRNSICNWIIAHEREVNSMVDYGGGFGALANLINQKNPNICIDIYEPYPSPHAKKKFKTSKNISFINTLGSGYDCLVSIDILEHVPDPLKIFSEMIYSVRMNGYFIVANCFFPVIKCHLPVTFHLRYTFDIFARMMGLMVIGPCSGSHAKIYKKISDDNYNYKIIQTMEITSRILFPFLRVAHLFYRGAKKLTR